MMQTNNINANALQIKSIPSKVQGKLIPYRKGGKWGFSDVNKMLLIPCHYDEVNFFEIGTSIVKKGNKYGLIDTQGHETIPCIYETLFRYGNIYYLAKKHDYYFLIDKNENLLLKLDYDEVTFSVDSSPIDDMNLLIVKKQGKYGIIDIKGDVKADCKFDYIGNAFTNEGLFSVCLNGKIGFINRHGKEIIPFKYDECESSFTEGLLQVYMLRFDGYTVHTPAWDYVRYKFPVEDLRDEEGNPLTEWHQGYNFGFINQFQEVIPCVYDTAVPFVEGLSCVSKDKKYGYIDFTGQIVIPLKYDSAKSFSEGLASVSIENDLDRKFGFIDKYGETIIPFEFDELSDFCLCVAVVRLNGKYGFIDKHGVLLTQIKYDSVSKNWRNEFDFQKDGFYKVNLDGQAGFVFFDGEEIFPSKNHYCLVEDLREYASSKLNKEQGSYPVSIKEEILFNRGYEEIRLISDALIAVKKNEKWGFINKNNEEIIGTMLSDFYIDFNNLIKIRKDNKEGYFDKGGNLIVPCKYEDIHYYGDGLFKVYKDLEGRSRLIGYVNKEGTEFWEE
jgi:hypothetical protein